VEASVANIETQPKPRKVRLVACSISASSSSHGLSRHIIHRERLRVLHGDIPGRLVPCLAHSYPTNPHLGRGQTRRKPLPDPAPLCWQRSESRPTTLDGPLSERCVHLQETTLPSPKEELVDKAKPTLAEISRMREELEDLVKGIKDALARLEDLVQATAWAESVLRTRNESLCLPTRGGKST